MKTLEFIKMHGCGNDFIIVNNYDGSYNRIHKDTTCIAKLCIRSFGIGSDGLILLEQDKDQIHYVMYNSDGSKSEMCGNGIRCFYKALQYWGVHDHGPMSVVTGAGLLHLDQREDRMIVVDMGKPAIKNHDSIIIADTNYEYRNVSMGNPHCILVSETDIKFNRTQVCEIGSQIETMTDVFPEKTNVEFVRVTDDGLDLQVWERGCGYTLACGTGACATVVGLIAEKKIQPGTHRVKLPGGELRITRDGNEESSVMMAGPAEFVFEGRVEI